MFRVLSFFLFLFVILGIILVSRNKTGFWRNFSRKIKDTLNLVKSEKSTNSTKLFISIKMIVYFIVLLCVVILMISGFAQPLLFGKSPSGILLLLHVTIAPIFAVGMSAVALLWAHNHNFSQRDWHWFRTRLSKEYKMQEINETYSAGEKICFWLGLSSSLPVILSVIFSMFPYFGTYGQEYLFQVHRYGAMALVIIVATHSYFIIFKRK
jgi:cytochrome b subunit of formate dehydrogenase